MEASKKIHDNKKKYKPAVNIWSSVRVKFVVIIVVILLVVISAVASSLAIAIIRPYKDLLSNSLLLQTKILLDNLQLRVQAFFSNPNQEDFDLLLSNRVTFAEANMSLLQGKVPSRGRQGFTISWQLTIRISRKSLIPAAIFPENLSFILKESMKSFRSSQISILKQQ